MATLIENINTIVQTKKELGDIIRTSDLAVPGNFADYPDALRLAVASGGANLSYYVTYSYLYSYVDGVHTVITNDISAQSYITSTQLSAQGYLTSIPSEYVTETELSAQGYVTSTGLTTTLADYTTKTQVNGLISYNSSTGVLTITPLV